MSTTIEAHDVVVIGAGLAGALMARRLADAGKTVVVLESRDVPGGLHLHSSGLALLGTARLAGLDEETACTHWALTRENLQILEQVLDTLDVTYNRCGSQRDVPENDAIYTMLQACDDTIQPPKSPENSYWLTQDDVKFSPVDLLAALLAHPAITLETRAEVQAVKISEENPAVLTIWARQRYLWADTVVCTGGAYASILSPRLQGMLHTRRVHTAVVQCAPTIERPIILFDDQVIITPQDEAYHLIACAPSDKAAINLMLKAAQQLDIDGNVIARHSGWVAESQDGLPLVGTFADAPKIYHLNALGFWGTSWAFVAAERLAELLISEQNPGELSLQRFL